MNDLTLHPEMREKILHLESTLKEYVKANPDAQPECPLRHTFAPGAYARQIFIPQGSLVVGKIHKHAHLNFLMLGQAIVATEDGILTYTAPFVFTSLPGTKRVVVAVQDVIWVTVHLTEQTDLTKIEEEIIAPTYAEFDRLHGIDVSALAKHIVEVTS